MTRVLVTGATGFVGRHLLPLLVERGHEVHAVARTVPAEASDEIRWHAADLLERRAADDLIAAVAATHLVHLAWYAEHGRFWHAPENLDWVAAGIALVRGFRVAGGERVVVAGTCAEYDWTGDCCDPETPLRPATLYGIAKNALREVLDGYAGAGGPQTVWGRIFHLYGPGEQPTRVVASVARALVASESVGVSAGDQIRDFLHVEDVASAFAVLLDSDATGALDVGSGSGVAVRDVLERLQSLAGQSGLLRFGEAPRRDEPGRIVADPGPLQALGWKPAIELDAGLQRTLDWWREALPANPGT
jgi:nucleoside-diphosphate-sugar epimerase